MDDDFFNEYPSEDGSGEQRHRNVTVSRNYRDSSSSPLCITSETITTATKRMNRITNEIYHEKYCKLKKIAKALVFENACLCDEVSQLQEKIVIAKEERRLLLRKLLTFQAQKEKDANSLNTSNSIPVVTPSIKPLISENFEPIQPKKKNPVKKKASPKNSEEAPKSRSKKKKVVPEKRFVPPIPLDCSGRPIFPMALGSLTVHSLGSIVHDRPGFHDEQCIFPVGFCSSRTYVSLKNPLYPCVYTCTILDGPFGPRFEITPDDNHEHPIVGSSVNECHSILLKMMNAAFGKDILFTEGQGAKFFGLSHPVIQNLIQSCAGARKCVSYRWIHFEVSKPSEEGDRMSQQELDPTVDYEGLRALLTQSAQQLA